MWCGILVVKEQAISEKKRWDSSFRSLCFHNRKRLQNTHQFGFLSEE